MPSSYYDIWDILKCEGEYYIAMYDTQDPKNAIILAPRGGPPPPSTKLFRLDQIINLVPAHVMEEMVEGWLKVFGHVKSNLEGRPQPCSMDDLTDLKLAINIFQVD